MVYEDVFARYFHYVWHLQISSIRNYFLLNTPDQVRCDLPFVEKARIENPVLQYRNQSISCVFLDWEDDF